MSAPEVVKVTIDDRVVEVPKGTPLVETAASAGTTTTLASTVRTLASRRSSWPTQHYLQR